LVLILCRIEHHELAISNRGSEDCMSKHILIFSDGTGQVGGIRPDQRLSNVYKMYRAMRPGPDSPIRVEDQVAFYDAGLGAGETGGLTFKRLRNFFAATVGNGIDENIIDCYEAIIAAYEPGDQISLIGFSRGAYTVRCVTNVLNHCGIPTLMPGNTPVPKHGPKLRKIASDAVRYVYNHGAGKDRRDYDSERLRKAKHFRDKYSCNDKDGKDQGNVQPIFVGVFDTVAALGSRKMQWIVFAGLALALGTTFWAMFYDWSLWWQLPLVMLSLVILHWFRVAVTSQFKYIKKAGTTKPCWWKPTSWASIENWHFASWNLKYYDMYLDPDVRFARHAISIDEARKSFPRVGWGKREDYVANSALDPAWMKQVWFAGNHSDIGGSYPENESRLSDIALKWMVDEMRECLRDLKDLTDTQIRDELMVTSPDPLGLQHDEIVRTRDMWPTFVPDFLRQHMTWFTKQRKNKGAALHPTVVERLKADSVRQMGDVAPYRPTTLVDHPDCAEFYKDKS
jgi:uncharacterized protein (DUF2235 family)